MPASSKIALFCTVLGLTLAGAPAGYAHEAETVKPVFQHAIPNIPGKKLVAVVVNYPPGGKSLPHHHAKSAFIYAYVLTGAIRSVVGTEPGTDHHTRVLAEIPESALVRYPVDLGVLTGGTAHFTRSFGRYDRAQGSVPGPVADRT